MFYNRIPLMQYKTVAKVKFKVISLIFYSCSTYFIFIQNRSEGFVKKSPKLIQRYKGGGVEVWGILPDST